MKKLLAFVVVVTASLASLAARAETLHIPEGSKAVPVEKIA
jgi:hypothetical protein